jgi:hypothetical protein
MSIKRSERVVALAKNIGPMCRDAYGKKLPSADVVANAIPNVAGKGILV